MAKYSVTRSCGHEEIVSLVGKIKDREWRLEKVEANKLCSECYQAEVDKRREEENRASAEAAKEMSLPQMTGTEKQVAWAETIRQRLLAQIDEVVFTKVVPEMRSDPALHDALQEIKGKTSASWWIDNRHHSSLNDIMVFLAEERKNAKTKQVEPPKEVVVDTMLEATIRPENPKTETVAEIRATEASLEIAFPERRDDFREVVKKQLHMEWSGTSWKRELSFKAGTPVDRAAEAGHRLLAEGFVVRIFDAEIRARAVAGNYESECTRWIQKRMKEKYAGWFAINWDRQDDFYGAAKRIAGAVWSNPSVVVPPESFDEVLDFAEMHGFKLSEGALDIVKAAQELKEKTLVVSVDAPRDKGRVIASGEPPVLEVPTEVVVADEFKD